MVDTSNQSVPEMTIDGILSGTPIDDFHWCSFNDWSMAKYDIQDARPQIWLVQEPPKKHLACMKCLYLYQYLSLLRLPLALFIVYTCFIMFPQINKQIKHGGNRQNEHIEV